MAEPRIIDLYVTTNEMKVGSQEHSAAVAHNSLVEMVLELRKEVRELKRRVAAADEFLNEL